MGVLIVLGVIKNITQGIHWGRTWGSHRWGREHRGLGTKICLVAWLSKSGYYSAFECEKLRLDRHMWWYVAGHTRGAAWPRALICRLGSLGHSYVMTLDGRWLCLFSPSLSSFLSRPFFSVCVQPYFLPCPLVPIMPSRNDSLRLTIPHYRAMRDVQHENSVRLTY